MNPYLKKLREKFDAMQASVQGLQTRAAEANRTLTPDELTTIKNQGEEMRALAAEIEILAAEETRAASVATMMATLTAGAPPAGAPAGVALGATTEPRDPGHYRSAQEGGERSFYGDMLRAKLLQDGESMARLDEHNQFMRAQTTTTLAGVVPPKWLADMFTTISQQDAALYDAVAKYTITDARQFSLPGQTVSTTVANQPTGENTPIPPADAYDAAAVNVTPSTIVGKESISRQVLDASNPAVDQLILADLTASYVAERELRIGAAIRAVGSALATSYADFSDSTATTFGYDLAVDAGMAVRKAMKRRPTFYALDYELFALYLKLKDGDGRPILVDTPYGPTNAGGMASLLVDGTIAKIPVVVSEGMNPTADAADAGGAMVHGPSVVAFESPQMSFRYEEKSGPESIELGLWRYFAVAVRQGTRAVKNVLVDDDLS